MHSGSLFVRHAMRSFNFRGRGRAICILICHHLEHTILLSKKRVKETKE